MTSAQLSTTSPYSRFGLGDIQGNVFSQFSALGGGTTSLSLKNKINPYNPATYSNIGKNTFLLSLGALHNTVNLKNSYENQVQNNTSFSHLTIAFPLNSKTGISIGLLPYSNIGYQISSRDEINSADLIYSGDGGLSTTYIGGSYKVSSNLSLGANANYIFGGLNRRKKLLYDDNSFLNSRSNSKLYIDGFYYQVGVLYNNELQGKRFVTLGISLTNNSEININRNEILETFRFSGLSEVVKDTVYNNQEDGFLTLPQYMSFGLTYKDDNRLLFIVDYRIQDWSNYKVFDELDNLINSSRASLGLQFVPDYNSITTYYKRISYRFGVSFANTPLQFYSTQLTEKTISLGLGLPNKKAGTIYDLSIILGERGTVENNLLKEQFIKFGLSISYESIWFLKRKYD